MKSVPKTILGLTTLLLSLTAVQAATPVTGYLEGENLGLIHTDYTSGVNPGISDPSYFIGNREDFYIDLDDAAFKGPGGAGNVTTISDIDNPMELCDETFAACAWNDFSWSPRIGWVTFDGQEIQDTAGMGSDNFPGGYFPHITFDGFVNGFAWGQTTGWIALSACSGLDQVACGSLSSICSWDTNLSACEMTAAPAVQNDTEWGVYLDMDAPTDVESADCESKDQIACLATSACTWSGATCEFEGTPRGRYFEGFAWSEHLGWISFENAATNWVNDGTEPELNIDAVTGDHLWFSNQAENGTINWENFAQDDETGIDVDASSLTALLDPSAPGDFAGCYATIVTGAFAQQGNAADVLLSNIGLLSSAPHGFCKYTVTGEIVNGAGLSFYIGDPLNNLDPAIKSDPEQYREAITIYTFAGAYVPENSTLIGDDSKMADGDDVATMAFIPKDIAGNPIVPVRVGQAVTTSGGNIVFEPLEDNWIRDVELAYSFTNDTYFDTINPAQTPGNAPIMLSNTNPSAGDTYIAGVDGTYPSGGQSTLLPTNNAYHLNAISFAPTMDTFAVNQIDMKVKTAELPAVTLTASPTPASTLDYMVDENTSLGSPNPLDFNFAFDPPFSVTNAGLNKESMVVGQPVEFSYDLTNDSARNVNYLALDHEFNFYNVGGGGFGEEVLEMRNIEFIDAIDDGVSGQTDLASGSTRYAVINPTPSGLNSSVNNTPFFNSSVNHQPTAYSFESNLSGTPSSLNSEGQYVVDGAFYGLADNFNIDRGDLTPGSAPFLPAGSTATPVYSLTPVQIGGLGFNQAVEFELSHFYIAYRMSNAPPSFTEFAVYEEANPVSNIEVKNIGLNTSGLVSGGQIFESAASGRTLSTISTAASSSLQREIHRNVAAITRNVTPCEAQVTLTELSTTAGECILVDETNKTIVAYYAGEAGDLLTFEGATGTITVPDEYSYTVIVEGGADVFIRSNFAYNHSQSSFGLIVFDDEVTGQGGNVYLDPSPTNMVGLLYTEGSLLSSPDGSTMYYGDTGDAGELINQLYWQGKIASENTLGGGPNRVVPPGITCPDTVETLACAQRYDLDYLRRFATINSGLGGDYSLGNGKFSGDGVCNNAVPECAAGGLPSTIRLTDGVPDLIDVTGSKSVDPVYIEPDSRRIPPGFSKEIDVMQQSVVR